jgi:hypothetical protein
MKHTDHQIVLSLLSWGQMTLMIAAVKYTTSCLLIHHKKSAVHLKRDVKLPVQFLPHTDEPPKTVKALLDGWNLSASSNSSLLS